MTDGQETHSARKDYSPKKYDKLTNENVAVSNIFYELIVAIVGSIGYIFMYSMICIDCFIDKLITFI